MPKQAGVTKITGTIGDITFYKTQDGLLAKQKSEISAKRIATDPAFVRTRENGQEFGRAGKTAKIIKAAFNNLLSQTADNRMFSRLVKAVMTAQKADTFSVRGERNIITGDALLLERFDFNARSPLGAVLQVQFLADLERGTGEATVTLDDFIPVKNIKAPDGTTHFKLLSAAAAINFAEGTFITTGTSSPEMLHGLELQPAITLTQNLPANSEGFVFIILGIEFYQQFNGVSYPLNSGTYNAVTIVRVDIP